MTLKEIQELFSIKDVHDMPSKIMEIIEGDIERRDDIYRKLLRLNNNDVSFDWFQNLYESELAERSQKKQDFTPNTVGTLCSLLTSIPKGVIHEPTSGNGGMIISDWWTRCINLYPWEFKPTDHIYSCWELSDRAIPILLLNLSIRGIAAEVMHGDVLEQKIYARYVLINKNNDFLEFSDIIREDKFYEEYDI